MSGRSAHAETAAPPGRVRSTDHLPAREVRQARSPRGARSPCARPPLPVFAGSPSHSRAGPETDVVSGGDELVGVGAERDVDAVIAHGLLNTLAVVTGA